MVMIGIEFWRVERNVKLTDSCSEDSWSSDAVGEELLLAVGCCC